jgi:hypothetical protein
MVAVPVSEEQWKAGIAKVQARDWLHVFHGTRLSVAPQLLNGFDANRIKKRHYNGPRHAGLFVSANLELARSFSDYGLFVLALRVQAKHLHGTDYSGNIDTPAEGREWRFKYPDSFRPGLSYSMLRDHEPQGLLRGLVRPRQITGVWYSTSSAPDAGRWYTRKEFLKLNLTVAPEGQYGSKYKIRELGYDLSNPGYSLPEFMAAFASAIEVEPAEVTPVVQRHWAMAGRFGGEDWIEEQLDSAGFGPTATKAFIAALRRSLGPAGQGA